MNSTVRIEGLKECLDRLKALPYEVATKSGGPVKTAVRLSANVIRDQMRINMQQEINRPNAKESPDYQHTGTLMKSVSSGRAASRGNRNVETYFVGVRGRARYAKNNLPVKRVGVYMEYGTSKYQSTMPLHRAWDSTKEKALQVMVQTLKDGITKLENRK